MLRLTDHHFAQPGQPLPPVDESLLLDVVVGGNGTFVRSRRPGLEACIPIALYELRGLAPILPYVTWGFPKVPARFLQRILALSRTRCVPELKETLFHLSWNERPTPYTGATTILDFTDGWHLEFPDQKAEDNSVVPVETGAGTSTERAIVELHSHHTMPADFSEDDDTDEAQGFRIYAVIGTIFDTPTIRVRVGVFGYFFDYWANEFFELPAEFNDALSVDIDSKQ